MTYQQRIYARAKYDTTQDYEDNIIPERLEQQRRADADYFAPKIGASVFGCVSFGLLYIIEKIFE